MAWTMPATYHPNAFLQPIAAAGFVVSDPAESPLESSVVALTIGLSCGDEESWRCFHRDYFERLFRYLLVVLRGDEDAVREALQQTMIRVHRHVRRFDTEAVFWSWLTVLARSAARDGARQRNRYTAMLATYASEWWRPAHPEPVDADPALERCLKLALESLTEDERRLLAARYETRQKVVGIAEEFGQSPKAVESRLARLRERLRAELLKRLRHESQS